MKKFKIFHSSRFDRDLSKLDKSVQDQLDKIEDQLIENPYVGRSLNVRWFREKKIGKHRIYYLIYDDYISLIMVGVSEKKDQQKVINTIRLLFEHFKEELERLMED